MVGHIYNTNTWEAEEEVSWVQGQPGLHSVDCQKKGRKWEKEVRGEGKGDTFFSDNYRISNADEDVNTHLTAVHWLSLTWPLMEIKTLVDD